MLNLLKGFLGKEGKEEPGTKIPHDAAMSKFHNLFPEYIGLKATDFLGDMWTIGRENLQKIQNDWIEEFDEVHQTSRTYEDAYLAGMEVVLLAKMIRKAESKPLLSVFREEGFFEVGETVMVFKDDKFLSAQIVELREEDPYTEMFVGIEFEDGCYAPYAFQRPEVLKFEDFETLKNDPEFFDKVWLESARNHGWAGFNASTFASALLG